MADARQGQADWGAEGGTNELELMEFTIAGSIFGINVAKVTEIMQCRPVTPMPTSHPCVEGVFKPRDKLYTVINLPYYMGLPASENAERDMFVLTNFSNMNAAFHVHTVEAMHRIRWSDVEEPDNTVYGGRDSLVTGNANIGDKMVTIVDFEKVLFDISPSTGIQVAEVAEMGPRNRSEKPVVIAEDSAFLKKLITEAIETAGYTNLHTFNNGQQAWDYLEKSRDDCVTQNMPIESKVAAIITDIEMPKMDGHHLTKLVKEDSTLSKIPVIVFSSLIDEAMQTQGERLGVNAHLSKPQIGSLVTTLDKLIL